MSFFERFKLNSEAMHNKKNADNPSTETDTEEAFIKNINVNKTDFPMDSKNLIPLKPLILKDYKTYQSTRYPDKDDSRGREAYDKIYISEDKMTAFLCVFPPVGAGADITAESLLEDLALEGITYGIDCDLIAEIAENRRYLCLFAVARGTPPTDGEDGSIVDFLARHEKMDIKVLKDNIVDFDKPILFHRVKKGEAICRVVPPEPGDDGSNIFGRLYPGRNGSPAVIPQGIHTVLSKDKTVLLAEIDGDISFSDGVFSIENRLVIEGDLTDPSEQIEFAGDIIIGGDVGSHVEIHAGGGVIIGGQVGAAAIYAGKYIYIPKGMGGEAQGLLDAHGDVLCKSVENVKINAWGNIYANIVNKCDITSDGSMYVKGGKGVLVGGNSRVSGSLEAKRIGNQSLCVNAISIGYNPRLNAFTKENNKKISDIEKTLEKIKKAKQQLTSNPTLSPERKDILQQMNEQEKLYLGEKSKLELERSQYLLRCKDDEKSSIIAESIYPLTIVTFRSKKLTVNKDSNNCKIFFTGSELRQVEI